MKRTVVTTVTEELAALLPVGRRDLFGAHDAAFDTKMMMIGSSAAAAIVVPSLVVGGDPRRGLGTRVTYPSGKKYGRTQ